MKGNSTAHLTKQGYWNLEYVGIYCKNILPTIKKHVPKRIHLA